MTAKDTTVVATLEPFINESFDNKHRPDLLLFRICAAAVLPFIANLGALAQVSCKAALDQVCARSRILILISVPLIVFGLLQLGDPSAQR